MAFELPVWFGQIQSDDIIFLSFFPFSSFFLRSYHHPPQLRVMRLVDHGQSLFFSPLIRLLLLFPPPLNKSHLTHNLLLLFFFAKVWLNSIQRRLEQLLLSCSTVVQKERTRKKKRKCVCVCISASCPCTITCCRDPFHFLDLNSIFLSSFPLWISLLQTDDDWLVFLCVSRKVKVRRTNLKGREGWMAMRMRKGEENKPIHSLLSSPQLLHQPAFWRTQKMRIKTTIAESLNEHTGFPYSFSPFDSTFFWFIVLCFGSVTRFEGERQSSSQFQWVKFNRWK